MEIEAEKRRGVEKTGRDKGKNGQKILRKGKTNQVERREKNYKSGRKEMKKKRKRKYKHENMKRRDRSMKKGENMNK